MTALTVALVPSDQLYTAGLWFDADDADIVQESWRRVVTSLPAGAATSIAPRTLPSSRELPVRLRGRNVLQVRFGHVGDPGVGARLLEPVRRAAPALWEGPTVSSRGKSAGVVSA